MKWGNVEVVCTDNTIIIHVLDDGILGVFSHLIKIQSTFSSW